ncbi:MAG: hypothetical protein PHS04_06930 [Tissierellia bacterium]|nr:hypothetical protein [Tissierellia bacterium]
MVIDDNIERLQKENREDEIALLLDGDEAAFYRIKEEDLRLKDDNLIDYSWYVSNFVDTYYALCWLLKRAGVVLPTYEDYGL